MTVVYFSDIRFPIERANGIQTIETCHALAKRGHAVRLVVRPDTHVPPRDPFAYYGLEKIATLRIERAHTPRRPAAAARAAYLLSAAVRSSGRGGADVIMTRDLGVASLLLRLPSAVRPPLVYESHGYAPDVAAALPALLATAATPGAAKLARLARRERHVWHAADGYVTITDGLARELTARFGPRAGLDVAAIADGTRLPADPGPAPPKSASRTLTIAYAGHLYAWKGVDLLLQALARVPGVTGLVVGGHETEPDLGRLRRQAAALGIQDRVTFTGMVPPPRVADLLRTADILALPNPASAISTRATSPLKLFEYMAARRAIVASDLPSIREVLRHEENALLVQPGSDEAIAAAIQRLSSDCILRERLAAAAWARAADYTWDRRAERLERLLLAAAGASR